MSERCGYPFSASISEWTCDSPASHRVIGARGSGYYETPMPRCDKHLGATISDLNPRSFHEYPYNVLARVEMIEGEVMKSYEERNPPREAVLP